MARVEPIRSLEDIERMEHTLRWYGYRDYMFFKIGINTALRGGDIVRLTAGQIRNTHLSLREAKTGKLNRFYINDAIRPILDDYIKYMADDEYLFKHRFDDGRHMNVGAAYRMMSDAGERIGLKHIGTHSCRKTFGYHFYRQTHNIALLMQLFNHSSEAITLHYIGIMQDEADAAIKDFFL